MLAMLLPTLLLYSTYMYYCTYRSFRHSMRQKLAEHGWDEESLKITSTS